MHIEAKASALSALGIPEILNSLPDGAYVTDCERTILFWNDAAERITGWRACDVVGRTCFDHLLCHTDQDGEKLCGHERCPLHRSIITGERSEQAQLVYAQSRTGERLAVEVSVSPLRDAQGTVVGGIEIFRDMSAVMEDLLRAREIQKDLAGAVCVGDPRVTFRLRSEASQLVGGDFTRVEKLDGDRYALLLLDVRGHGLAAALYTMYLRAQWDGLRDKWARPSEVLAAINRHVFELAPESGYLATAVTLLYDAGTGELALVRAGHPAPVWLAAGRPPRELGACQPALGLLEDSRYREERITLAHGDTVLVYSDGAIEMCDRRGEELGLTALLACLQAVPGVAPDLDAVPEALLRRSACIRQPDDLTLLTLTRH